MIKKKNYIKACALGLMLCIQISLLGGCDYWQNIGQKTNLDTDADTNADVDTNIDTNTEEATLWVLTEISKSDGMNYQAETIARQFEEDHEGITVQIEILPTEEEERKIYLKQLRTQIMAGEGPDVYLLPTGDLVSTDMATRFTQYRATLEYSMEPLFRDVMQAMYNGIFADVSQYYDADVELHTEELNQDVMNAGVIDGCRYVLPIRYDMQALFTDPSNESSGVSQNVIDGGIDALVQEALDSDDALMAIGLYMPTDTSLLPTLFDYEKGEMLVTEQEIADYMRLYQAWYEVTAVSTPDFISQCEEIYYANLVALDMPDMTLEDIHYAYHMDFTLESFTSHSAYISSALHWSTVGVPLYSGFLPEALDQAALTRLLEKELEAQPMRATDGSVVAEVTYYGAVGAGTENPELAYEFLREFLTEGYQWDILRPRTDRSKDSLFNLAAEVQTDGLVEDSWPVRAKGAAYYLWENWQYQIYYEYSTGVHWSISSYKKLRSDDVTITDEDMSILDYAIDEVRFPITQDYEETLEYALTLLNHEDGTPTDVDIDALAKEVYKNLWWHLAEG